MKVKTKAPAARIEPAGKILAFCREAGLFGKGDRVLAGVSGGADSTALLHLLAEVGPGLGIEVGALHVHHGMRGEEADRDAEAARKTAGGLGVAFSLEQIPDRDLAARRGSLEAFFRRKRYEIFETVAGREGFNRVAVAHTEDDVVETLLLRLLRGAGLSGLPGIPASRPLRRGSSIRLVRPLLRTSRREIEEWLGRRGIEWVEDSSNRDPAPLRNRIRHELLPLLEKRFHPGARRSLAQSARGLLLEGRALDGLLSGVERELSAGGPGLPVAGLRALPREVSLLVLRRAAERELAEGRRPRFESLEALLALALGEAGGKLSLPGRGCAVVKDGRLVFCRESDRATREGEAVPLFREIEARAQGRTEAPELGGTLAIEPTDLPAPAPAEKPKRPSPFPGSAFEELADAEALRGRLTLRTRRPGDRFQPLGLARAKRLQDFFVNLKVPRALRDRTPVLCLGGEPVWVIGFRLGEKVKVTSSTRRAVALQWTQARRSPDAG